MRSRRQGGMTLIELLVVVAIIGVLSAIAIWNYFIAIQRAKQKRTMADMRAIAMSWEVYAQENQSYVPASATVFDFPTTPLTGDQLRKALVPKYLRSFPSEDGWGNEYDFAIESSEGGSVTNYAIRSRGADATVDDSYDQAQTSSFNNDIIFSSGVFVVSPKK